MIAFLSSAVPTLVSLCISVFFFLAFLAIYLLTLAKQENDAQRILRENLNEVTRYCESFGYYFISHNRASGNRYTILQNSKSGLSARHFLRLLCESKKVKGGFCVLISACIKAKEDYKAEFERKNRLFK